MIAKLTQLWHHLDHLHQWKVILILLLTLSGAFLEMVGLGLIYLILNFVVSGEMPMALTEFLSGYGLNDNDQIAVYAVIFFASFFLFKNLILTYFTYHLNLLLKKGIIHCHERNIKEEAECMKITPFNLKKFNNNIKIIFYAY